MNHRHAETLDRLGLASGTGFPNDAYCFTDGQISLQIEKNGGVNELHLLSLREKDGRICPENSTLPILSKSRVRNYSYGFYGPVIRFVSSPADGRNFYHIPDRVRFLPFGISSSSERFGARTEYDVCVKDRLVLFSFRNEFRDRKTLDLLFCVPGLATGQFGTCVAPDESLMANALYEKDVSGHVPVRQRILRWGDLRLDAAGTCLCVNGYADRVTTNQTDPVLGRGEPLCLAIGAGAPMAMKRRERDYLILSQDWGSAGELHFALVLENSADACRQTLERLWRDPAAPWREQVRRYSRIEERIPSVRIEGKPVAEQMARTIPLFVNAMRIFETDLQATTRAATHKFAYFPIWDVQWPARAFLVWGQHEFAKKVLRHSVSCLPWLDPSSRSEVCYLLADCYALTRDRSFLEELYGKVRPFYREMLAGCDSNGLRPGGHYGADDPRQLKLEGPCIKPDSTGWTFNAARAMQNLAMTMGDAETAAESGTVADRIQACYLKVFFDEEAGYLTSGVSADTLRKSDVYQNVSTMAMEGAYGDLLLDPVLKRLAAFQKKQLCHPSGRTAVPYWCPADEMWKSCLMLQHAHHEARTARFAGESEELLRMWGVYMDLFDTCKLQIETINLCGLPGDPTGQRADWQAFGATAQYLMLLDGIIGIEMDYGGLTYLPCNTPVEARIDSLRHGRTTWDVAVSGAGDWVELFQVDGKDVRGAFKTPSFCFDDGHHELIVRRGAIAPSIPCILRAFGAGLTVKQIAETRLVAVLDGIGRIPVRFFCPRRPVRCSAGQEAADWRWNASNGTGIVEVMLNGKAELVIEA